MNLKLIAFVLLTFFTGVNIAQDCSKFYPFSEGTISKISTFNKKGKEIGSLTNHVKKVTSEGGLEVASMSSKFEDSKGKFVSTQEFDVSCNGDIVSIDFKSLINPILLMQYKDMEYDITGMNLELPNDLFVGQELADANLELNIDMAGIKIKTNLITTDRTVLAKESLTTPAGTFDCYVITYSSEIKMSMGVNQKNKGKQWISEGVGLVKQEEYNAKGKLTGSSVLTEFNK